VGFCLVIMVGFGSGGKIINWRKIPLVLVVLNPF
jgi:hypothetical protein